MDKIDIILPTWNNSKLTLHCLCSLKAFTDLPYRVIWVDNGSEADERERVQKRLRELNIEFVPVFFSKRLGPIKAMNEGMRLSTSRYAVWLNNDVCVTGKWLNKLIEIMDANPDIGTISPITDNIASLAKWNKMAQFLDLNIKGPPAMYFNSRASGFVVTERLVSFFCTVVRREVVERVGLLHEGFIAYGGDDDYCDRVKLAGFKTAIALNCFVYHEHRASVHKLPESELKEAKTRRALLRQRREQRAITGRWD